MVCQFFEKASAGSDIKNEITQNQQLTEELYKPIIKRIKKTKKQKYIHHSIFNIIHQDNIWCADLADIQLISKFNKEIRFLLCIIDTYSKYAWVIPLKDKKGVNIANAFQKILDDSRKNQIKCGYIREVNYTTDQ